MSAAMSNGLWLDIAVVTVLGLYALWKEFGGYLLVAGIYLLVLVLGGLGLYALVAVLHWFWRIT